MKPAMLLATMTCILPVAALADPLAMFCKFDRVANPDQVSAPIERFEMTFIIDPDKHAAYAYMVGGLGTSTVQVIQNAGGLTFLEITATGNVMTTTVLDNGRAVHSRNTVIIDELLPPQYYGKCTTK